MRISDWSSDVALPICLILTVYNQNLGLVSETRRVELPAGETVLALEDVSSQLQPETVLLAAPGLRVIEQSLAGDLLTPQRLLEASLGETVQIIRTHPETGEDVVEDARVLSLAGGLVVQIGNRVRSEEHTSELQSLMRSSYAVFCLKNKNTIQNTKCNTDVST